MNAMLGEAVGRLESITVYPGDFGKRFVLLEAEHAATNREINEEKVKLYMTMLDGFLNPCVLKLVRLPDGKYIIIDGQHRISAASRLAYPTVFSQVIVHTPEEILATGGYLKHLEKDNAGGDWRGTARLQSTHHRSPWPANLEQHGFKPVHSETRNGVSWTETIRACLLADYWRDVGMLQKAPRVITKIEPVKNLWLGATESQVLEFAKALQWSRPLLETSKKQRIYGFTRHVPLGLLITIYRQNKHSEAARGALQRLIEAPNFLDARGITANDPVSKTAAYLLEGMNYRQAKHKIVLFGQTRGA